MAKIESVKDLPRWFSLVKYEASARFDAVEWYRQLLERQSLFIEALDSREPNSLLPDWYPGAVGDLRESPLELPESINDVEVKRLAVSSLRAYDLRITAFEEMHRLGRDNSSGVDYHVLFDRSWQTKISVLTPGSNAQQPAVVVDLGATDSTLKAAFAIWLAEARRAQPASAPSRSKPNWRRWARYGLLPYIDLWIWSIETGNHIPDRVMSAAITTYDAGEANLRKTVVPLAKDLLLDLSALQALAAMEGVQNSSANSESFEG